MPGKLDDHLQQLLSTLCNQDTVVPMNNRWEQVLTTFYDASSLERQDGDLEHCQLSNQDRQLQVPAPHPGNHYLLLVADNQPPFDQKDIQLLESLLKISRQFVSIQQAHDQGAETERQRIARDLHDDVAARLLTLIHKLEDQDTIELTRSILKALRNAIYTLDSRSTSIINHALTDIRSEIQDRLNSVGIFIDWHQIDDFEGHVFTPRQHINLQRIFHEITTNTIRHAQADYMQIIIEREQDYIHIIACDNGLGFDIKRCIPGKGINNIQTRVEELSGKVEWKTDPEAEHNKGCCIDIRFPLVKTTD